MRLATLKYVKYLKVTVLALGAAALTACMIGPHYAGPPPAAATAFHNGVLLGAPSSPPAAATWWTGFDDPLLTRIIERALAENLDLKVAQARVERTRAAARAAGANRLPAGEFEGAVTPLHQSLNSPIGTIGRHLPGYDRNQTLYDLDVGAQWDLDLFGGLRRLQEVARSEAEAMQARQTGVRIAIAAEVADAYFLARGAQARLALAQSQVDTDARLLELVALRVSRGAAASKEMAQAEALLAHARGTMPRLRTELERQSNRLDVLMGALPGTYAAELAAPAPIPVAPGLPADVDGATLLRQRPDVRVAERELAAANARIGVAVAEYYPKVSLSALLGFESLGASQLLSGESFQPLATAGLRWRLFDFRRVDAEVSQAGSAHAETLLAYRQTVLRATEDVENAFMALAQLGAQDRELHREVDALARAREASQDAYLSGASSLTDVLDADRQSLEAEDALARTRADVDRATVVAYHALGGGWTAPQAEQPTSAGS